MKEKTVSGLTSKARLLVLLRNKQGEPLSGSLLAKEMGVSRVAIWKTVQALTQAGYAIETGDNGYSLNPKNEKDFLYPWEFGEKENMFFHYMNTGSTMDRAREQALRGAAGGSVFTAEKQTAGRGRSGRTWVSRQGGLFFSFLERPRLAIADYSLLSLVTQIAVVRTVSSVCGKKAYLRWPNDIYINRQKIAGVTTEISGEGDLISWLSCGVGVNINNPVPSGKAVSCAEITGHHLSRRAVLNSILNEIEKVRKKFTSVAVYSQGNRALSAEWNSLADCVGAKAVVFEPEDKTENYSIGKPGKILARGIFSGIDPAGRCVLKTEKGTLYFNQGTVSLAFLNK
ncbi:MAG: biotin--[acetyl-CoA-carboxylase] ligase [Treponema sp.]|jgi:BirA family biotin operon repressor/biotin-[acetyl-CoA-carboxylase] ligase|nr:biotin--[acetyl-CoA-carboxylase] ligase [Treponema sp.]